jgi:energy-converting hydrogenase A subunit M
MRARRVNENSNYIINEFLSEYAEQKDMFNENGTVDPEALVLFLQAEYPYISDSIKRELCDNLHIDYDEFTEIWNFEDQDDEGLKPIPSTSYDFFHEYPKQKENFKQNGTVNPEDLAHFIYANYNKIPKFVKKLCNELNVNYKEVINIFNKF